MAVFILNSFAASTDKTFVSWLTINDREPGGGAGVSVKSDKEFDALVYGGKRRWTWMAGSHHDKRTQKQEDLKKNAQEPKESAGLIQVAGVYKGNTITIYRNGELYTSYEAQNIDVLSDENNIVTMGLAHVGGHGSIAASIEDTRIYSQALTLEQLKAL